MTDTTILRVTSGPTTLLAGSSETTLRTETGSTTAVTKVVSTRLSVPAGPTILKATQGIPGSQDLRLTTPGDLLGFDTAVNRFPVGSDNQILIADSGEAFGFRWAAQPVSSPLTTKGDIYAFDSVDARLPVGADGQFLRANSAPGIGLEWDTLDAGDLPAHAANHENGGSDELNLAGMSGLLATAQIPVLHAGTHENGGSDEINVAGLSGLLADQQAPIDHAADHLPGGGDPIATAVPVVWGLVNAEGTDESLSRSDHVHASPLARPVSLTLGADFLTLATAPVYVTLFTLPITTLLVSGYIRITFTCMVLHTGAFAGNVAPTVRFLLNGTPIQGGSTVNMPRSRIMPLVWSERIVVSAGLQTVVVEISKFAGPANTLSIQPVTLPDLMHAHLRVAEEF